MPENVKAHVTELVADNRVRAEKFWDEHLSDIPRNEAIIDALTNEITAAQRELVTGLIARYGLLKTTEVEMVSGETLDFPAVAEGDR